MLYAFGRCKVIESLFTKLYFLSSRSLPVRRRRRGNYAFRRTNHHRIVDYSSEPNSLLRCRKTIRRREFHFCNNTTDTYFLSIKLSRLRMQIIPPNRIVPSGRLFGEVKSLFKKLYFLSSHSFPDRRRRRGNYAFRSTNHNRFVDYSSEPNSLLRCRKTIRRREYAEKGIFIYEVVSASS